VGPKQKETKEKANAVTERQRVSAMFDQAKDLELTAE